MEEAPISSEQARGMFRSYWDRALSMTIQIGPDSSGVGSLKISSTKFSSAHVVVAPGTTIQTTADSPCTKSHRQSTSYVPVPN
jgi:hypothetical protein